MSSWISSVLSITCLLFTISSSAQQWTVVQPTTVRSLGKKDIVPQKYVLYKTDDVETKRILWTAPEESDDAERATKALLAVGLPDGTLDTFRMVRYEMMEPELATKYPDIRTFVGYSVSNPYRTIRADWTESGFRAVMRDENGMMYIDHYQRNDMGHRISYYRKDYINKEFWTCAVTENAPKKEEQGGSRQGDCQLRTYRLAQAADAEYSNYFGATSAAQSGLVMSAVVTAINRVNQVYEADITVRLILVSNTNNIFFYNSGTDPYTNDDGGAMLGENQTTCDNVAYIGSANYDIGHVFSTGGGGVAYLGAVCDNSIKAGGVTGLPGPVGDAFYIDYVAHEMGHQFGGSHTFNSTQGSCNGNRSASSAYEVGSGTTIMGYAGICGTDDVQPHSDAYFHARSLQQIATEIASTSCAGFLTLNNTVPTVTSVPDYSIPISTPFVLTGIASDPNGDPLTYCWEEYDLENPSTEPPVANDTDGPLFRSFSPKSSPSRYFPRIEDIISNTSPIWEVLPSAGRVMNFRLTIRDFHNIAGCTKEDNIIVTSVAAAGPFTVTSQNAATSWTEGSTQTITWNVANTTASPISCQNIDIKLSLDGGLTYPTTLLANDPNDGSATINVPLGTTTTARVMVKASNNIFFDINNVNITIVSGAPTFTIALNPTSVTECNDGAIQTSVIVGQYLGYNTQVSLSLLNAPAGSSVSFSPQVVNPGNNSTLVISNLTGLSGTYTPIVRGTSNSVNKDVNLPFTLLIPLSPPTLTSPVTNSTNETTTPLLDWSAVTGAVSYDYQISTDINFTSLAQSGNVSTDQFQVTSVLQLSTLYYWRIRTVNLCGPGAWASVFSFTVSCFNASSSNVPLTISSIGTPTINSTLNVTTGITISDVNVTNLTGTHTWIDDLIFTLIAPNNTQVIIWNRPCDGEDNFNINFDDEAANSSWPCPPTNGLTYKPNNPMTSFDGLSSSGNWTLKVQDVANQDGGSLNSWSLKVCGIPTCQLIVNQANGSGAGTLAAALSCAASGDSIKISAALAAQSIDVGATPLTINKNVVIIALGANTGITTSGTRVFEVTSGTNAQIVSLTLKAGTSLTGAAINNSGQLTLKNVNVLKNPNVSGASLIQDLPGGGLTLIGACNVQ